MERVKAWERLNDPDHSSQLTMGEFYDLAIQAGYSHDEAHKGAMRRGWDRLEAGVLM